MRSLAIALAGICFAGMLGAEPLVPGYERFGGEELSLRGGAILFSELGCANCHGGSAVEVPRQGPSLAGLASRVNRDWVLAFLRDPQGTRPGSTMPALAHDLSEADTEALVAYLGTLGKPLKLKAARHANAERGSALYHEQGCVACHAPTPDYRGPHGAIDTIATWAVPMPDLQKKTGLVELQHFLQKTRDYRPDGRMPHFPLAEQDALDLAAHLLDYQSSDPRDATRVAPWPNASAEQIAAGRKLFLGQSCHACHETPGTEARPLTDLAAFKANPKKGGANCLDDKPHPGLPSYQLTDAQRRSLLVFLSELVGDRHPEYGVDLTLAALNCYACHERGGRGGPTAETQGFFVGEESLGDSGRLPPPLTGIGHKLRPEWLTGVFEGKNRVRPYLKTQMPAYHAHAKTLTALFASIDHPRDAPVPAARPEDLAAGRQLLGTKGGVNCVTCHNWEDQKSPGIPGPDLSALEDRLQPSWFRQYLLDPTSYRPGTLMPGLWPGGHSTVPDVLEGDTERQIAAIWGYIKDGQDAPEGYVEMAGDYELIPKDRPIVQRAFFEKAGGRAILVGFPGGVHLAFDGERGHPAMMWRGRFFDAYETWFLRKAEFQKPLGKDLVLFETPATPARFRGYELDAAGHPVFQLEQDGRRFTETYRVQDGQLLRTRRTEQGPLPLATHPKGLKVTKVATSDREQTFLYAW